MWQRVWAVFKARNRELYRDRSGLGWNIFMPFLTIFALAFVFGGGRDEVLKVGVLEASSRAPLRLAVGGMCRFGSTRHCVCQRFATERRVANCKAGSIGPGEPMTRAQIAVLRFDLSGTVCHSWYKVVAHRQPRTIT
jgi:hypothetical protein